MQFLHLISIPIALSNTLSTPTTYPLYDVCWAFHCPQTISHGMPKTITSYIVIEPKPWGELSIEIERDID